MTSFDIRSKARALLSGKWLMAVIAGFLASVLGAIGGGGSLDLNFSTEDSGDGEIGQLISNLDIPEEIIGALITIISAVVLLGVFYSLISFVIGSVVSVGYAQFNLDLVDERDVSVGTLFSRFGQWKTAIIARLMVSIRVMLWSLLFVIPGIIASYDYAMVSFVLADNPEMSYRDALEESKRLMLGNRWRLFCLEISFIGWAILSLFTLGIGSLFLVPYTQTSHAVFYRDIKAEKNYIA